MLTGSFSGVFFYDEYTMSIMKNKNEFYFMNHTKDIYVKGKYEKKSENIYYISVTDSKSSKLHLNRKFQFMFDGEEIILTKCEIYHLNLKDWMNW